MAGEQQFEGVVGRWWDESTPWWPEPDRARPGSPNVMLVVLDDVGFAQLGCFGSDIATPAMDRLAERGLRYSNFHTTALCSPTRACLLTGRNHHSNGMGRINDLATGFPGYNARIPRENGFLSEMLQAEGYATWAVGKWHLTPSDEVNAAAPKTRWPLSRGFEGFYGFFGGETHQFAPALWHDNHQVEPWGGYDDGYHLTEDMADRSIGYVRDLRQVDPDKPFFLYFAPGACHSPHQAPDEWIERYRGHFDDGWDLWRERTLGRQIDMGLVREGTELPPMPDQVHAWKDLSDDERRLFARYQEAFAGFLSHTDHQVGRILDALEETGDLDNTIVIVVSDNGASAEGGPYGSINDVRSWNVVEESVAEALTVIDQIGGPLLHNNYPWGWTVSGNTPFRRWKRETHEGGVADPMIVSWPAGIEAAGEVRDQYVHAIDVTPTLLEVLGITAPDTIGGFEQTDLEGVTFANTFTDADSPANHVTQYYEMLGCRGIHHDGWKAVIHHLIFFEEPHFSEDRWELYNTVEDPAEMHDLADQMPEKVKELEELWWQEARKYNVLPLDNRPFSDFVMQRPKLVDDREQYIYWPGTSMVDENVAANLRARPHSITAEVDWTPGDEGVLLAQGASLGGFTLFVKDGQLHHVHNLASSEEHRVTASLVDLSPGPHRLGSRFIPDGEQAVSGESQLLIDGEVVATTRIPRFTALRFSICGHGLTCGRDTHLPVVDDYASPFAWTGQLDRVVVEVSGEPFHDPFGEAHLAAISQ